MCMKENGWPEAFRSKVAMDVCFKQLSWDPEWKNDEPFGRFDFKLSSWL